MMPISNLRRILLLTSLLISSYCDTCHGIADEATQQIQPSAFVEIVNAQFDRPIPAGVATDGQIDLEDAIVHLTAGNNLSAAINDNSSITVRITFPEDQRRPPSAFRLIIEFSDETTLGISCRPSTAPVIERLSPESRKPGEDIQLTLPFAHLKSDLLCSIRYGLLEVSFGDHDVHRQFLDAPQLRCRRFGIMAESGEILISQLTVHGLPAPQLNAEQTSIPEASEAAEGKIMTAYRNGNIPEALQLAEANLRSRQSIAVSSSPELVSSMQTVGVLRALAGKSSSAIRMLTECLGASSQLFGDRHPQTASVLNDLASAHHDLDELPKAALLYAKALSIREELFAADHPDVLTTCNNLAGLYTRSGSYEKADNLYTRVVYGRRAQKDSSPDLYAQALSNHGLLLIRMGRYHQAFRMLSEARGMLRPDATGRPHPGYASVTNNLALLYDDFGDFNSAKQLYLEVMSVLDATNRRSSPQYATTLNNLGTLAFEQGEFADAELYFSKALTLRAAQGGADSLGVASVRNSLALVAIESGDLQQGLQQIREALSIRRNRLPEAHPHLAESYNSLAMGLLRSGRFDESEEAFRESIGIRRLLGTARTMTALDTEINFASLDLARGRSEEAEQRLLRTVNRMLEVLNESAPALSERQQLLNLGQQRTHLDQILSIRPKNGKLDAEIAELIWKWKCRVSRRQASYRASADSEQFNSLLSKLRETAGQLAADRRQIPAIPPVDAPEELRRQYGKRFDAWKIRQRTLREQREALERRLAELSPKYQRLTTEATVEAIAMSLPPRSVLIDFLYYNRGNPIRDSPGMWNTERQCLAVKVTPAGGVQFIELGPAPPIDNAIRRFREALQRKEQGLAETAEASKQIHSLLWLPLQISAEQISKVHVVPDEAVATLPFSAISDARTGRFLIEDFECTFLPWAQAILRDSIKATKSEDVLLVGGVDYSGTQIPTAGPDAEIATTHGPDDQEWIALPGTDREVLDLRNLYIRLANHSSVDILTRKLATKNRLLDQLTECTRLHVASHGFSDSPLRFKTPEIEANLMPDLFSGIVLATHSEEDSGLLTAAEIAGLSLPQMHLAVLSACRTGLGTAQSGEGLSGLTRAFHIAGARNVVSSLWRVPDEPTRQLMLRFYWYQLAEGQSVGAALRSAQLEMLEQRQLPTNPTEQSRSSVRRRPRPGQTEQQTALRTAPWYWAGWTISGNGH